MGVELLHTVVIEPVVPGESGGEGRRDRDVLRCGGLKCCCEGSFLLIKGEVRDRYLLRAAWNLPQSASFVFHLGGAEAGLDGIL